MISEEMKSYAAAVVDSGSYFSLKKAAGFGAMIRIRRTSKKVIEDLHSAFGGYLGRSGFVPGKEDYYWVYFNGQTCTEFLKLILPYMKVKIEQAQIIMEYNYHLTEREAKGIKPGTKLDEAERQYRQQMCDRLQALNH